ncbi:MAG: hypothetical protein IKY13_07245 [Bacteroidaceae bacterium]|nr:hypothetical protein [Bacteroidaceae bacterium]
MNKNKSMFCLFAALSLLLISSCSMCQSDSYLYSKVKSCSYDAPEEHFDVYVDKFYRDLGVFGIYPVRSAVQIVKFSKMDQIKSLTHINALSCGIDNDELIEIYINPYFWEKAPKALRYWVMYHELAHDVLNISDLSDLPSNNGRLMYPYINTYEITHMDQFIEASHELFDSL